MMNRMRNGQAIASMWRNWAYSMGAPTLVILLSLAVSPSWLPVVAFALEFLLFLLVRSNREAELPTCFLTPFVMTRILFWSALVMALISILSSRGVLAGWFELVNPDVPYIPILVIGPIGVIVSGWAVWRRNDFGFCRDCRLRYGGPAERGFLGKMFSQEGHYQVKFMFGLAIVTTVVGWTYFALVYINVNLNRPDKFFFVWLPLIFYGVSLVYMAMRYFTIWSYYDQELAMTNVRRPDTTLLRYIILDRERIYLTEPDNTLSPLSRGYDTPATVTLSRRENVPVHEARGYFREMDGSSDFAIRFMYQSTDAGGDSNVFHYLVNVDEPEALEGSSLKGEWFTIPELERLLNSDRLAPLMAAEIHRLYTVTMAWKTYDRRGRRLYKIKNYRPTFRLRDIQNWDVDFNDVHWLRVAVNNQDRPFYSLKRFWRRYVNGVKE